MFALKKVKIGRGGAYTLANSVYLIALLADLIPYGNNLQQMFNDAKDG